MTDLVKVALIAATPPTITAVALLIPVLRKLSKIADGVDGINTGLKLDAERANTLTSETQSKLSHAEGRREGVEASEQNRTSNDSQQR